jgi:hypothetical protein
MLNVLLRELGQILPPGLAEGGKGIERHVVGVRLLAVHVSTLFSQIPNFKSKGRTFRDQTRPVEVKWQSQSQQQSN